MRSRPKRTGFSVASDGYGAVLRCDRRDCPWEQSLANHMPLEYVEGLADMHSAEHSLEMRAKEEAAKALVMQARADREAGRS